MGRYDFYFISPMGKKLRSIPEVQKSLEIESNADEFMIKNIIELLKQRRVDIAKLLS